MAPPCDHITLPGRQLSSWASLLRVPSPRGQTPEGAGGGSGQETDHLGLRGAQTRCLEPACFRCYVVEVRVRIFCQRNSRLANCSSLQQDDLEVWQKALLVELSSSLRVSQTDRSSLWKTSAGEIISLAVLIFRVSAPKFNSLPCASVRGSPGLYPSMFL